MAQAKHPDPVAGRRPPAPHAGAAGASVQSKKVTTAPPPAPAPPAGNPRAVIQKLTIPALWEFYLDAYDRRMADKKGELPNRWFVSFTELEKQLYAHKKAKDVDKPGLEAGLFKAHQHLEDETARLSGNPTSLSQARDKVGPRLRTRLGTAATVICEMWDTETQGWYGGRSAHNKGQGNVPGTIWNRIPPVTPEDKSDWGFGGNCAEVDAIIQAYAAGKVATDLRGCYFIAFHIPSGRYIGPCRTCKLWIRQSGGEAFGPNG